jgi:ABC-type nickel/cobalt efflux system permease component RcnA
MWSLLGLAVLIGMRHALEADHVAAVSSLAAGTRRMPDMIAHGLTWGFGHTATLLLFAGGALILGQAISETLATQLEVLVGLMLVGLGSHVLWRLWRDRLACHDQRRREAGSHPHADGVHRFNWRTLFIGMTHGMAGSAALLLLTVTQIGSPWVGLAYVMLFGIGSMLGMAAVSAAIGLPLALTARSFTSVNRGLQMIVGATTAVIGISAIHAAIFTAS